MLTTSTIVPPTTGGISPYVPMRMPMRVRMLLRMRVRMRMRKRVRMHVHAVCSWEAGPVGALRRVMVG
jgi:hypothetical protein